jgi:hypothetical protein
MRRMLMAGAFAAKFSNDRPWLNAERHTPLIRCSKAVSHRGLQNAHS